MTIRELFAMNIKYYRKKYNLSQEKFAAVLGTSLPYLNILEKGNKDIKSSTIDKFAKNINKYDKDANITSADLVVDDKSHITKFNRIDEKK